MAVTRKKFSCVIFGTPQNLPANQLPTYTDFMKKLIQHREDFKTTNGEYPSFHDISYPLCYKVEEASLPTKASLPTVTHQEAVRMLLSFHKKYNNKLKPYKGRKDQPKYQNRLSDFRHKANFLFDLSKCKCTDLYNCKCPKEHKVPAKEREFLEDQRGLRRMIIGSVNKRETLRLKRKACRMKSIIQQTKKQKTNEGKSQIQTAFLQSDDECANHTTDDEYIPPTYSTKPKKTKRKRNQKLTTSLPSLAQACDKTGVSDRSAAVIATSILHDIGIVSPIKLTEVIDRNKIRRERKKKLGKLQQDDKLCFHERVTVYFDGRKDKTVTQLLGDDRKYHKQIISEEHITMVVEPKGTYFNHTTPNSGSSKDITDSIVTSLKEKDVNTEKVQAVECDGTNVNTGQKAGVIRRFEESFNHPLQWLVCLLHTNELPLRHFFEALDGSTSGPRGYFGSIGRQLETCTQHPVTSFKTVGLTEPLSILNPKEFSTDQQYLLEICNSISNGNCTVDLASRNPGCLNHSRWLTTANESFNYMSAKAFLQINS